MTAKKHLVHCFPDDQPIFQYCLSWYHEAVTKQILDIIETGLEGNEFVSLLQWVISVYPGPELLGHDRLDMDPDMIPSVLAEEEIEKLITVYLANMKTNYETWMTNTIKQEVEDWAGDTEPEIDMENCYYTSTPVLINRFK